MDVRANTQRHGRALFRPLVCRGVLALVLLCACHPLVSQESQSPLPQSPAATGNQPPSTGPGRAQLEPNPVVSLHGRQLFAIRQPIGAYTAQQRAADISERLRRLTESGEEDIPTLRLEERNGNTIILAGAAEIMAVTDADATAAGEPRAAYAQRLLNVLAATVTADNQEFSWRALWQGALYAGVASVALFLFFVFTRRGMRSTVWWIREQKDKRIHPLQYQKTVLLSSRRITRLLVIAARFLWLLLLLLALYIYLPIVFRFFPYTREISDQIIIYTLTPIRVLWEMFIAEIPNFFFLLVIAAATHYAIRFSLFIFREIAAGRISFPGFYPDWAIPTFKIVRVLLIAFALVIAYPYIPGSDSDAFKGISIFFGILFSLGSTGIVSNIVSGVILTYTRAFVIGDRVKIGETTGDVIEKTMLVTRLRTIKNVDVSIPNSMLLSSQIVNYSAVSIEKGLILHTTVTIGYDAPWRQVQELLIQAALGTPDILESPKPFVLQTSLDDFYVSYELNAYTNAPMRMAGTYSQLHANIQDRFNEAGVEIMSPHYRAARDGNQTTIPAQYLPGNYRAPAFRMESRPMQGSDDAPSSL